MINLGRYAIAGLVAALILAPVCAQADPARSVNVAPPAGWILPPPVASTAPDAPDASMRIVYSDIQTYAAPDGQHFYQAVRYRLLKPEALALGNLSFSWQPNGGSLTLHWLRVIHAGQVTDLTHSATFRVLEREPNLEQAMFDGQLTATWQIPGLAVGDEFEYAITSVYRDPTLPDARGSLLIGPQISFHGTSRIRLAWPTGTPFHWQASKDLGALTPASANGVKEVAVTFTDPSQPDDVAQGAPLRFGIRRLVEGSSFADWPELSRRLFPVFDKAATIAPNSPLQAEIARIAAASQDPAARAEAALQLIEDRIRYVFVALNNGNLTPAGADETWQRRFGDCKAKTALLIALLRGLGVPAEPLLVNSGGIDGLPDRLPDIVLFNHVVVRATIGGKWYVLDATRSGDRHLALLPPVTFRQGLPLTAAGAAVASLPTPPPAMPELVEVVDIDSTAGIGAHAKVRIRQIYRGDFAIQLRTGLAALSAADGERALRKLFAQNQSWVDIDHLAWHADDDHAAMVIDFSGEGDTDWTTGDGGLRSYSLPGGGFSPPERLRRPHDQDQTLPWTTNWPRYRCWVTTMRLPRPDDLHQWSFAAKPVDRTLGGIAYWRRVGLTGNVVRLIESTRTLTPEISAAEASALNAAIGGFDNNMAWVNEQTHYKGAARPKDDPAPFADTVDWTAPDAPCMRPSAG
jgi:transglutaminase-like putative cysteine protease